MSVYSGDNCLWTLSAPMPMTRVGCRRSSLRSTRAATLSKERVPNYPFGNLCSSVGIHVDDRAVQSALNQASSNQ
jgi:hypothetical protein